MQEQINALKKEIEELNERIEELEAQLDDISCSITDNDALVEIENMLDFSFLDNFPVYTDENIIILHSNPYRTYKLVDSCEASCGIRNNFHKVSSAYLTPELFIDVLSHAPKGEYILLTDNVFSFSSSFEKIMLDYIAQGKVFFIILTNDLEKVPKNIREKMRVIQ